MPSNTHPIAPTDKLHHRKNERDDDRNPLAKVPTADLLRRLGVNPDGFDQDVMQEVSTRYLSKPFRRGERMDSAATTAARLQARFGAAQQENFVALALDSRLRVLREIAVAKGGLSEVHVRPREVFHGLILENAASTIVAHNHPSGDPEPSREDIVLTQRLVMAGELLGIQVLDHLVLSETGYVSLLERGHVPTGRGSNS